VPANLTPEYFEAEERYKAASTTEEKLSALEEMLRVIPKHKGTEKMQADIKRRLSRLRKSHQKEKSSGVTRRPFHYVPREGAGRVVVCGPPNCGKSSILRKLTHAKPEVAPYPFTTRIPLPGMLLFEDIQIQLVDTPPLSPETLEPWQLAMLEQADVGLLLFDVTDPQLLDQTEFVLEHLSRRGIQLEGRKPKMIVLGNKIDLNSGRANYEAWSELYGSRFSAHPFSTESESDLQRLPRMLFEALDVVRVYTKPPGGKVESEPIPYVLERGARVLDAATAVHKDLAQHFKYARIWGEGLYEGQMVERDHQLRDGDILEIHGG
jgi:small GTP-binding protein